MAIARKPKPSSSVDIDALINRGGSVATLNPVEDTTEPEKKLVNLLIPVELLAQIDEHLAHHPLKVSRRSWLLEAVYEKLVKERS